MRFALKAPALTLALLVGVFVASLVIYPFLGLAFFPRTDAGQFTVNLKVPTGTRIEVTNDYVAKIEDLIRHTVAPKDLKMILSNIGVVNDISSLYTTNAGMYTAFIQVALNDDHEVGSFEYMDRVRAQIAARFPDVRTFFQSGSLQDAILNQGQPAPIDVQVNTRDLGLTYNTALNLADRIRQLPGVGEIYIPQDMNYPSIRMDIDRVHAGELGLSQKDVVDNVITALNSNIMIAPNYWVDYQSGNDYFLSVQYYEHGQPAIHNLVDLKQIPLRAPNVKLPTTLDSVVKLVHLQSPTEVDHYQIQRVVDVYVTPVGEDFGRLRTGIVKTIADAKLPSNIRVTLRGMVNSMDQSFKSFGLGFGISFILLFLILVAQFKSWIDPILIMLAIPMGFVGVLIILAADAYHAQRDVADGRAYADRHRGLQQHSDCRFRAQARRAGIVGAGRGRHGLPRAPAAHSDDVARNHYRNDPDGFETRRGRRAVHAHGPRHHRRPDHFGVAHHIHRARRLSSGLWEEAKKCSPAFAKSGLTERLSLSRFPLAALPLAIFAQTPPMLTLQQAEAHGRQEPSADSGGRRTKSTSPISRS